MCGQRLVVSNSHYFCVTIPVLLLRLISSRHTTCMPSYYNFAWLCWADGCLLLCFAEACGWECLWHHQSAVQRRSISSSDQHAITFVHIVELYTSPHLSVNVLMTSCKPHLNWTVLEVDYHCAGEPGWHSLPARFVSTFRFVHFRHSSVASTLQVGTVLPEPSEHVSSRASESQSLLSRLNWARVQK